VLPRAAMHTGVSGLDLAILICSISNRPTYFDSYGLCETSAATEVALENR